MGLVGAAAFEKKALRRQAEFGRRPPRKCDANDLRGALCMDEANCQPDIGDLLARAEDAHQQFHAIDSELLANIEEFLRSKDSAGRRRQARDDDSLAFYDQFLNPRRQ